MGWVGYRVRGAWNAFVREVRVPLTGGLEDEPLELDVFV